MKKAFLWSFMLLFNCNLWAQQVKQDLGTVDQFKAKLSLAATGNERARTGGPSHSNEILIGTDTIRLTKTHQEGNETSFWGNSVQIPSKKLILHFEGDYRVAGTILDEKDSIAQVFSTLADGMVHLEEVSIDSVICIEYHGDEAEPIESTEIQEAPLDASPPADKLQSLPDAEAVIYLDFDGEVVINSSWNGGERIDAVAPNFSNSQIKEIWLLVSEDFMPFEVNVTTDRRVFNDAPNGKKMQVIFTPSQDWRNRKAGGVAYLNSFRWRRNDPCWVFNKGTKGAAEAASHEVGHTLGLSHDGVTDPQKDYYSGHGDWGPIMGASYKPNVVQWSKGEYLNANRKQDDLAIITSGNNGFTYRNDANGNGINNASLLKVESNGAVLASKNDGIIERNNDRDVFKFTTTGGAVDLLISPASNYPNLNIKARLLNKEGNGIQVSNPGDALSARIQKDLNAGTYYLEVDGVGDKDPLTTGYTGYASLGYYSIKGTVPNQSARDCAGVPGGTAFVDQCGECVGGNTGQSPCTIPLAVTNLKAPQISCTSVKLTWNDNSNNENGFYVRRREEGNQETIVQLVTLDKNTTSYTDNTVQNGLTYEYKVRPFNQAGVADMPFVKVEVPYCNLDCAGVPNGTARKDDCGVCSGGTTGIQPCSAPERVTDVAVVPLNCEKLKVTWKDNSNNEDGFEVRRREVGSTQVLTIDVLDENVTSYIDQSVVFSKQYEYKIRAFNEVGNQALPWTTHDNPVMECIYDCAGVLNGQAKLDDCDICSGGTTGITPSSPTLWYQDADKDGLGNPEVTESSCEKPDGYVANDQDPCPGDASNQCNLPEDIVDLSYTPGGCEEITLLWSDVENETGYRIRRKLPSEPTYTNLTDVPADATSFIDSSVMPEETYQYMVRPLVDGTAVALSNVITVQIPACVITSTLNKANTGFIVYPNPAKDQLTISKSEQWYILNIHGVLQMEGNSSEVDIQELAPGSYIIKVGSQYIKFMKW